MKLKRVIFIANDFGFGPLSRTYTIAKALSKYVSGLEIRIVTTGKTDYLFNSPDIIFDHLDDMREPAAIRHYLEPFERDNTLLISTMNRFAIVVAKSMDIRTLLVDGLYWFWLTRPKEYEMSDYQFRMVLPWQLDKYKSSKGADGIFYFANPVETPTIANYKEKMHHTSNTILFTLNGFVTPYYKKEHEVYLEFAAVVANNLSRDHEVHLTGNREIKEKLARRLDAKLRFVALDKLSYLRELQSARYVLLNGGSNSFLEALAMGKNMLFSLPSNQSQYALIHEVARYTKTDMTDWCPLLALIANHETMLRLNNESVALDYWAGQIRELIDEKSAPVRINTLLSDLPKKIARLDTYKEGLEVEAKKSINSPREIAATIARLVDRA